MSKAIELSLPTNNDPDVVTFGICATADPRIDQASRDRTVNIIKRIADTISGRIVMPNGEAANIVYSTELIYGEKEADIVAKQFKEAGVGAIICTPDTWAFPQLTLISLLSHFPKGTPVNITCGNSAPKPGVVFAHAVNGALAQSGILSHLNIGSWADFGEDPIPTDKTTDDLVDWCYGALTTVGLKGKRVVVFGHDSMGMETALSHIMPTRNTFGLEITRLDMKLLADMLNKGAYDKNELKELINWTKGHLGSRLAIPSPDKEPIVEKSLAMYLIMRDLLKDVNAVGGSFMNQLEWGSDNRGIPLPICDLAESLFNSTFDHNGPKAPIPFATEADNQALLTMLFKTWLSGGNPPLFMDFRKVWSAEEAISIAKDLGIDSIKDDIWATKGFIDGDNSGSASLNWAAKPGASIEEIMKNVSLPWAEEYYFPGGGNSVSFISPGGINGIASRLAYSSLTGMFSLIWDEAYTIDLPDQLAQKVANSSNITWPHTWVTPKYGTMNEYKQYSPANHFHMTWNLSPARLQYWMDMTNVLSVTPWQARPSYIEGVDRPQPLIHLINGGEERTKILLANK